MTYLPKKYRITGIKQYTSDVKLLKVRCNLNPKPGQFLEVSVPGIGECPLASCSYNNREVYLLTRNAGNVTSAIFHLKNKGDIYIRGPYGHGYDMSKFYGNSFLDLRIYRVHVNLCETHIQRTTAAIMHDTLGLFSFWAIPKTTAEHENKGLKNFQ